MKERTKRTLGITQWPPLTMASITEQALLTPSKFKVPCPASFRAVITIPAVQRMCCQVSAYKSPAVHMCLIHV